MRLFLLVAIGFLQLCTAVAAQDIVSARYAGPTRIYDHGVLGDKIEYSRLVIRIGDRRTRVVFEAGEGYVFEDIAPRVADLNGDGRAEVIVVRTSLQFGASLAIYGPEGLITQTPAIGSRYRWLAPAGVGDFDGDGRVELAYVETPHLGKTLKIYKYLNRQLLLSAEIAGLSNHRIGDDYISGGVRNCGMGDEIITADASWQRIMATRVRDGILSSITVAAVNGKRSFEAVMSCR